MKKDKDVLIQFDGQVKDIRQQVTEQLKCLDSRVDTQAAILAEIQDYFRRRAEVELEYSKSLDKLAKTLQLRHKTEKQKREQWPMFSSYMCWQHLVSSTKQQARHHAVLSDMYTSHLLQRFSQLTEDIHRIYRRCRDIGLEGHEELLKVLRELHISMKTYQSYNSEFKQAENKLQYVEAQRLKFEQSISPEKLDRSKKYKLVVKEIQKRQMKFNEAKLKAVKACNDYILTMEAANASIRKYFVDDLSDLIDCMDFGLHTSLAQALHTHLSAEQCVHRFQQTVIDGMYKCVSGLDSRLDKQRFLEANNAAFMVPRQLEGEQVSLEKGIQEEMDLRYKQLNCRIAQLTVETEEIWKTLETAEHSLLDMISSQELDVPTVFEEEAIPKVKPPETLALKLRADRQETEDFYLNKFQEYLQANNLIARLQSKSELLRTALGYENCSVHSSPSIHRPHSLPHKARKKRIGQCSQSGQPKLFGGSLEEYVEVTNQEIPLIIKSCIRIINLYGLHHQGVFRVSGSQVEINNFRECFEKGDDPLADMTDASDLNSVAGVLKLYLRELREPLFPIFYFDQLVEISQVESKQEFITKVKNLVGSLPRSVYIVLRYLFAFLNHLSEFSDENMMDPYNLAICFGPTLLPIPEDKDQVQYQNLVNELVKNIIVYQDEIFVTDVGPVYEKYIASDLPIEPEIGESPADQPGGDSIDAEDDSVFRDQELALNLFGKAEALEAVAQYDFLARSERELSFKRGDTLQLYTQVSNDWWRGSFAGHDGLVPDKYILLKIRDEERPDCRRASSSSDSLSSHKSCSTSCIPEEDDKKSISSDIPFRTSPDPKIRRRSLSPSSFRAVATWKPPRHLQSEEEKTPRNCKDTPDLVLDLPVNPSSPTTSSKSIKDSPEEAPSPVVVPSSSAVACTSRGPSGSVESPEMTGAERFALSNQCTMKKGTITRSRTRMCDPKRRSEELKSSSETVELSWVGDSSTSAGELSSSSSFKPLKAATLDE